MVDPTHLPELVEFRLDVGPFGDDPAITVVLEDEILTLPEVNTLLRETMSLHPEMTRELCLRLLKRRYAEISTLRSTPD